ncbi:CBS domain-containing protein [Paucibacter sp. APW11]|uniref:CBS domain-containing protein n=1 Tax=Roseateles aquae TaxID=3077235 RepID=A0ABU3PB32_9BURK|nr:CBS domain-containing protein [Paucibacter sp. APW11]MDT8999790.1 CBS domain-containing protein [Paucibacter sp. APW11]
MFTVYGLNGRVFSGSVEGVRGLGAVQAAARLRAVEPVRPRGSGESAESVQLRLSRDGAGASRGGPALPGQQAVSAYAQAAAPASRQNLTLVEQLMSRQLVSVSMQATLAEAWRLLVRRGVGQAPVLDRRGRPVGLLLRADLLPLRSLDQPELLDLPAWEAWLARPVIDTMWTPVPSATPETPLREVAQLLLDLGLPGLPVVDEDSVAIGFLSRSDLLRAMTREPPLDLWS